MSEFQEKHIQIKKDIKNHPFWSEDEKVWLDCKLNGIVLYCLDHQDFQTFYNTVKTIQSNYSLSFSEMEKKIDDNLFN